MRYKFCPKCSGRLTTRNRQKDPVCQECGFVFYQYSKPTASALVTDENRIILVKRAINPFLGWWDIPGGFLKEGEHPEVGVRREVKEELGVEITIKRLLGVYIGTYGFKGDSTLNFMYITSLGKGVLSPADDVARFRWFSANNLPKQIAFKPVRQAIIDWKKSLLLGQRKKREDLT